MPQLSGAQRLVLFLAVLILTPLVGELINLFAPLGLWSWLIAFFLVAALLAPVYNPEGKGLSTGRRRGFDGVSDTTDHHTHHHDHDHQSHP